MQVSLLFFSAVAMPTAVLLLRIFEARQVQKPGKEILYKQLPVNQVLSFFPLFNGAALDLPGGFIAWSRSERMLALPFIKIGSHCCAGLTFPCHSAASIIASCMSSTGTFDKYQPLETCFNLNISLKSSFWTITLT